MKSSAWIMFAAVLACGCARGARRATTDVPPGESPAVTSGAGTQDDALNVARPLFYRAVEGDGDALRQCERSLVAGDGEVNAKVLAYRGGCEMLRAARAPLPWDKGRHARAGLTLLDRAVREAPDDVEIRFVRGMTSYHLPRFFGRSKLAAADLAAAASDAEASADDGRMDRRLAAAALFHHGVLLQRTGKPDGARNAWRRSARVGPDTPAGAAAARKLGEGDSGA
jgi:hypothetical protein